jgi:hypothetical protein
MDRPGALAGDLEVLGESEGEQPVTKRRGVVGDDAGPDALLPDAARTSTSSSVAADSPTDAGV